MSRLAKKCFAGATGFHLLLLGLLIVGPAFFVADKVDESEVIEFIPMLLTDEQKSGGGSPAPQPAAPAPQTVQRQPQTVPERQPVREPDPPKVETPKDPEPDRDSVEPKPVRKPRQVQISDKIVKLNQSSKSTARSSPPTTANNARQTEAAKVLKTIGSSLSSSTKVEMPDGPGGGGVSYANYAQEVRRVYTEAWRIPPDVEDDQATVKVSVTIARNGNVVRSRIIQSSGSSTVDRSIQTTLDRVNFVAPFPKGSKDSERTFNISFSLKAKNLLG